MNKKNFYTLRELADFLSAECIGDADRIICGIGSLPKANSRQISFLNKSSYRHHLSTTKAAVIVKREDINNINSGDFILVNDPYLAQAKISSLFDDTPEMELGIHHTSLIGKGCEIGEEVSIGPYCVIGRQVKIGLGVRIDAGCIIGDEAIIEDNSKLYAHVTLYHKVRLGKRVTLHGGVVIGSDGFGNANDKGVWYKIYQLGTVIIGDDVEIGANTTIDRGAIEDTVIENGVKIDNLVQIAHNVRIGEHTAIAGCVGIAGSTKIGSYCMIGGGVGISGHIEIADRTILTGMTSVSKSIKKSGGVYASAISATHNRTWWRILARIMNLEELVCRIKVLEKKLL